MSDRLEGYTDKQTGIRLTVDRDDPDWPHITMYPPDGCKLTSEEMNESVRRLLRLAGYDDAIHKWVERKP